MSELTPEQTIAAIGQWAAIELAEVRRRITPAPLPEEPEFVEVRGGRVHIIGDRKTEPDVITLMMGEIHTRCGMRVVQHNGGQQKSAWPTARFEDEQLCQRCHATVPEADQARLFEHQRPGDQVDE